MPPRMDRTGERGKNNFGSEIVISRYSLACDVDIHFPQYEWTAKNRQYKEFTSGTVKCPYERRIHGVGYLGEGDYLTHDKKDNLMEYQIWYAMLGKCYNEEYWDYKYYGALGFTVCEEWHCYQNFAEWYHTVYKNKKTKTTAMTHKLLNNEKVLSPQNCIIVPRKVIQQHREQWDGIDEVIHNISVGVGEELELITEEIIAEYQITY